MIFIHDLNIDFMVFERHVKLEFLIIDIFVDPEIEI